MLIFVRHEIERINEKDGITAINMIHENLGILRRYVYEKKSKEASKKPSTS